MIETVLVWDLETIPDITAGRRLLGMTEKTDAEVREAMGDGFQKLPLHKIVCIGALVARFESNVWRPKALGAPNINERPEEKIIGDFVDRIAGERPMLVSFNGHSFDLPVLRYRAMINQVSAPGLEARAYFNRYTNDALDLCDCLSSFDSRAKMSLHALCQCLSLSGKPDGMDGSRVEEMVSAGRVGEVAAYCECDVVNTYAIWLRYVLFLGRITIFEYTASMALLNEFLHAQIQRKPHFSTFTLNQCQPVDSNTSPNSI